MTVKELLNELRMQDGELPVMVQCQWEGQKAGDPPPHPEFYPHLVACTICSDTAGEFVVILCSQDIEE